jgi:hypothetical protein
MNPVFDPPEFLITFNCPKDVQLRDFEQFKEFENLRIAFSAIVKGNHSHLIFLDTPLHVDTDRLE